MLETSEDECGISDDGVFFEPAKIAPPNILTTEGAERKG